MRDLYYERRIRTRPSPGMSRRARSIRALRRYDVRVSLCSEIAGTQTAAGIPQEVRRQTDSPRAEAQGQDRTRAAEVRQLKRLVVRVPRQFGVRQPLADDLR